MRFLSMRLTCEKVDKSRATIFRMLERGEFPRPVPVGRRISFVEDEVEAWQREQVAARDAGIAPQIVVTCRSPGRRPKSREATKRAAK